MIRQEALQALQGSELIIHAGDIGNLGVLEALGTIARVVAVRGNIAKDEWARTLPESQLVETGGTFLYVLHDVKQIALDAAASGFHAVISGHSHLPSTERRGSVFFLNPGSAGPRRFRLPVSVARLQAKDGWVDAEIIQLKI